MFRPTLRRCLALLLTGSVVWVAAPNTAQAGPSRVEAPAIGASDLSEGSIGPRVQVVQQALIDAGVFLPGGADGIYGPATTRAIGHHQGWNGLERTRVLDAATMRSLGLSGDGGPGVPSTSTGAPTNSGASTATSLVASASPSSTSYGSLALGSTGPAVVEVQRALLDTGLVIRGGADGVFGYATRRGLMAYQRVNAVEETGRMSDHLARLMRLGTSASTSSTPTASSSAAPTTSTGTWNGRLERFPVQGICGYVDTWQDFRGANRRHEGVDVIAASGNLLYAVADGTITTQYWDYPGRRSGNGVKLTTADGTYFLYLHMLDFAPGIAKGTRVKAGDVLGTVGSTGFSGTPHLHFEIHPFGGSPINPYPYVKAVDDCSNTAARYQSSFA